MPSEPGNLLTTQRIPTPTSTSPSPGRVGNPQAADILKGMQDAESPLDFIRKNLRSSEPPIEPQAVIDATEAARSAEAEALKVKEEARKAAESPVAPVVPSDVNATDAIEYDLDPKVKKTSETKVASDNKTTEVPTEDTELDTLVNDEKAPPVAENFKRLRLKLKETAHSLKEAKSAQAETVKELEGYKTGSVLPEVLMEKENRIAELERYEKLHSLKTSKEYQEKFVQPLSGLRNKLHEMAADYELPKEVMDQALGIRNKAELNRFLANNFDEVGALEAKQVINQINSIQEDARDAEAEPAKALDNLIEEHARVDEFRDAERRSRIADISKDTWVESLVSIREEGKIPELIMKESDPTHNDKFVKPILQAAASEYGRLVRALAEGGLKTMPKDLGYALARMVQLAHASAVSIESRAAAMKHAEDLERNIDRTASYYRPQIGSAGGGVSGSPDTKAPSSPLEAADVLINQVMSRRK